MEIRALSRTDVANLEAGSRLAVAVAKKSLDATKQEGAAALSLLRDAARVQEQSAGRRPSVPGNPNGVGGNVDVFA